MVDVTKHELPLVVGDPPPSPQEVKAYLYAYQWATRDLFSQNERAGVYNG